MGRGGRLLNFNADLQGNRCITSHRERRAGRRPTPAAVSNNLQPFSRRRKAGREGGANGGVLRAQTKGQGTVAGAAGFDGS